MHGMRCLLVLLLPFAIALPAQQDKIDFQKEIAPILLQRCVDCHGPKKHEGKLQLDRRAHLFHGEQDKWVVKPGDVDGSELLRRVQLPAGDDDAMPAEGQPLSPPQIELLKRWVAGGADWPAEADALFEKAEAAVATRSDFALPRLTGAQKTAIEAALALLQQQGVVAQRVAADTEAVDVNFSLQRDKVGDRELAALEPLAPVLVWLNLARTAVTDQGLQRLAALPQLRRLNLANTAVGDAGLQPLAGLQQLEYLNLYGSKVSDAGLQPLQSLGKLRKLFVWQTAVTDQGAAALVARLPQLLIDRGEYVDQRLRLAAAEIAARELRNQPINSTCPVSGKPIDPATVIDHDGLRIAFCCNNCRGDFQKEPAKFQAKIDEYKAAAAAKQAEKPAESKTGKPAGSKTEKQADK